MKEETLYDSNAKDKAKKYDEMMGTIKSNLYQIFIRLVEKKSLLISYIIKNTHPPENLFLELEALEYELLELMTKETKRALLNSANKEEE